MDNFYKDFIDIYIINILVIWGTNKPHLIGTHISVAE